jgi:hypothetical protein
MDLTIDQFLAMLPTCIGSGSSQLPMIGDGESFRSLYSGLEEFVAPKLCKREGNLQGCKVIIVSGAGAVGKTTFARQIAFKCDAPYWDLAADQPIGAHGLDGALVQSFGYTPAVENHLKGGKLFLIVDAFDEARVKAGEDVFKAFIENIAKTASKVSRAALILVARTRAAEDIWLLLSDKSVDVCLLEIRHFERKSANDYIDKRIKKLKAKRWEDICQRWEDPYRKARDTIFEEVLQLCRST